MVRDLYMFSKVDKDSDVIWFKITYKNTLHSEADITAFFAENNCDIRFAYLDSSEDPSKGKYVMFTEAKKGRNVQMIADKLSKMDVVLNLKWGYSKNRVIQSVEFPLNLLGGRAVIIRARTFINILEIVKEHVPQSDGLLTIIGIKSGVGAASYLREMTDLNEENCLDLLRELFMASGWGLLEYDIDFTQLTGIIKIEKSFLAEEDNDRNVPACGYISSFLAGYISEALGKTVQIRETRCKSITGDYCEHTVSPAPRGAKIEHLLRGESH